MDIWNSRELSQYIRRQKYEKELICASILSKKCKILRFCVRFNTTMLAFCSNMCEIYHIVEFRLKQHEHILSGYMDIWN